MLPVVPTCVAPCTSATQAEPVSDTNLIAAAADLDRLDAEIAALAARHPGQDLPEIRGFRTREAARDKALRTLCRLKAQGAPGLEAKARALRSRELKPDHARFGALSASLSADLDRLGALGEPAPPPVPEAPPAAASDDSALLALAAELEAAASAYLGARDRAEDLAPSDPGHDAAMARNRTLHRSLEAVTDRIFAHRPTTLAGVLLTAHAASVMAQEGWDEAPEHVDNDGRLLRSVCDGLSRLAGVDWRGRPAADLASTAACAPPLPPTASSDAAILALVPELEAAARDVIAFADRDQFAAPGAPDYDAVMERGEAIRKRTEAVARRIFVHQPRTLAGLLATAHAVAAVTGELWDAPPVDLEYTDTLLRVLPDKLFALCGVDWRGRPLAGAPSAPLAIPEPAAAASPDAAILALGEAFDTAFAAYLEFRPEEEAAGAAREEAWAAAGVTNEAFALDVPGIRERYVEVGAPFEAAIIEGGARRAQADGPAEAAFRLPPPRTLAGVAVLARMLAGFHVELWDGPLAELDIEERMLRGTVEAALAVAGVDRLGRPITGGPASAGPTEPRPCPDAALTDAAAELDRLDGEIEAVSAGDGRNLDHIPAFRALEARRLKVLRTLRRTKARTAAGLEAKARALRTQELYNDWKWHQDIAVSLAEDIGRLTAEGVPAAPAAGSGPGEPGTAEAELRTEAGRLLQRALGAHDARTAAWRAQGLDPREIDRLAHEARRRLRLDALFEAASAEPPARADGAALVSTPPDPILAAIEVSRAANAAFSAFCYSPALDDRAREPECFALGDANAAAWKALLVMTPATVAGARALAAHAAAWIPQNGKTDMEEAVMLLHRLAGCAGDDPGAGGASDPVHAAVEAYRGAQFAWLATPRDDAAAFNAAIARKDARLAEMLAIHPLTAQGCAAYATCAVFGFADIGQDENPVPAELLLTAARTLADRIPGWRAFVPPFDDHPAADAPLPIAAE